MAFEANSHSVVLSDDQTSAVVGSPCTACGATVSSESLFCGSCGETLNTELDRKTSRLIKLAVQHHTKELLDSRFTDQTFVELETAERVAERVIKWAKLAALAMAIPLALLVGILSFLGIETYSDFIALTKKIQTTDKKVEDFSTHIDAMADEIETRVQDSTQKLVADTFSSINRNIEIIRALNDQQALALVQILEDDFSEEIDPFARRLDPNNVRFQNPSVAREFARNSVPRLNRTKQGVEKLNRAIEAVLQEDPESQSEE